MNSPNPEKRCVLCGQPFLKEKHARAIQKYCWRPECRGKREEMRREQQKVHSARLSKKRSAARVAARQNAKPGEYEDDE